MKPIVALFTDFGVRDAYVAQMKGAILSVDAGLTVVDLNHEVPAFNVRQAAYLLEASSRYLPAGSIVVTVVDPGVGTERRPVLCRTRSGRWFVGPDNGLLTLVLESQGLGEAYELTEAAYFRSPVSATFHGRDIFGPVAAHLACGVSASRFGRRVEMLHTLSFGSPRVAGDTVAGEILHVDHYGNIISNVTPDLVAGLQIGRRLAFVIDGRRWTARFCATYGTQPAGSLITLVSSGGTLEIACTEGSAAARVRARAGDAITFEHPI